MWNAIWVTADFDQANEVMQAIRKLNILTKCRKFEDSGQKFYEILVPSAEKAVALDMLAEL